ncbi:hypothetical protein ACVSQB_40550, partial [Bradyrhizobium elkanii]
NPWPASIGIGGRLRSEYTADFVGMRMTGIEFICASAHQRAQFSSIGCPIPRCLCSSQPERF